MCAISLFVFAVYAAGCNDDSTSCQSGADCFQGESCVSGQCVPTSEPADGGRPSDSNEPTDSADGPSDSTGNPDLGDENGDGVSARDTFRDGTETAPDCEMTEEICNGKDDDCDGTTDEGFDPDGDGTPTCRDECPMDDDKVQPGICGCGTSDTDSDGDGTADCEDGCEDDPDKTEPGLCGCGRSDTDTDGDGTPDCNDECPNDDTRTETKTFYEDADSDGYGEASAPTSACTSPVGYVENDRDCDDTDGSINPDAKEVCYDGKDNDCDSKVDCADQKDCARKRCSRMCSCIGSGMKGAYETCTRINSTTFECNCTDSSAC